MNFIELEQKAKECRKAKKYEEALPLYIKLWEETNKEYHGAGLLHCLRKLKLFDKAIPLSNELSKKVDFNNRNFDWCRGEIIWTHIEGELNKIQIEDLVGILNIAEKIVQLKPEDIALQVVVFKVLKSAKKSNRWNIVNEWIDKLDPLTISNIPMTDEKGRKGWCKQSLWYNYKIKSLIESKKEKEAIMLVDEIVGRFPKQQKFFLRLKALAFYHLGNFGESEKVYKSLCSSYKPDWWLIHEYAKVVRDMGRKEDSLKLMCQSANANSKIELMVSLFEDIGMLCKDMKKFEMARNHLALCKHIRIGKGWKISEAIIKAATELNEFIGNTKESSSVNESLGSCRSKWIKYLGQEDSTYSGMERKVRKGLSGIVSLGGNEKLFCFILTKDKEKFFCLKKDLSADIRNDANVIFDAVPSFNKKKNEESWKAANIRRQT